MEEKRVYTKGDYKRLSNRIRQNPNDVSSEDTQMLQDLRVSYKSVLSEVFNTISHHAHKVDKDCVCTYRIKRIESIISKIVRFEKMEIQRASDIAGCRCIMKSEKYVLDLLERLKKIESSLPFTINSINNYIENPKEDGYRSIHLNVKMKKYPGKTVEIQIRSIEHHNWATLVEVSDLIFKSKLKEYGPNEHPLLYEFHQILAKPKDRLTLDDHKRLVEISGQYKYLSKLLEIFKSNIIELRQTRNKLKRKCNSFYLISTSPIGKPEVTWFENFSEAEQTYFDSFTNNPNNNNIVLTFLEKTDFAKLSMAYSNYFLTYNSLLRQIFMSLAEVCIDSYNSFAIRDFKKYYNVLGDILLMWIGDTNKELDVLQKDYPKMRSKIKQQEWISSINGELDTIFQIIKDMNNKFNNTWLHRLIMERIAKDIKATKKEYFEASRNNISSQ